MMKKLFSILLCLCVLTVTAACSRRSTIVGQETNSDIEVSDGAVKLTVPFEETAIGKKTADQLLTEFEALQNNYWPILGTPYYKTNVGNNYAYALSLLSGELIHQNRNVMDEKAEAIWETQISVGAYQGRYYLYVDFDDGEYAGTPGIYSVDYMLNDLKFEVELPGDVGPKLFLENGKLYYAIQVVDEDLKSYHLLKVMDLTTHEITDLMDGQEEMGLSRYYCVYREVAYYYSRGNESGMYALKLDTGETTRLFDGRGFDIQKIVDDTMYIQFWDEKEARYTYDLTTEALELYNESITWKEAGLTDVRFTHDDRYAFGFVNHTGDEWGDDPLYEYYTGSILYWDFQNGGEIYRIGKDGTLELFYKGVTNGKPDYMETFTLDSQNGVMIVEYNVYDDMLAYQNTGAYIPRHRVFLDLETGKIIYSE